MMCRCAFCEAQPKCSRDSPFFEIHIHPYIFISCEKAEIGDTPQSMTALVKWCMCFRLFKLSLSLISYTKFFIYYYKKINYYHTCRI